MEARSLGYTVTWDGRQLTLKRRGYGPTTVELSQILGITLTQPVMLRAGRLTVSAAGVSQQGMRSPHPLEAQFARQDADAFTHLHAAIMAEVDRYRRGGAPAPAGGDSLAGELAQLAELARIGALTPDEYATAKARLLGR